MPKNARRLLKKRSRSLDTLPHGVAQQLARDLRNGRARWPVKTGYSKRNFYAERRRRGRSRIGVLRNRAPYAIYVERNQRVISNYARRRYRVYSRRWLEK